MYATRNYVQHTSSIDYSLKDSSRYTQGITKFESSTEQTYSDASRSDDQYTRYEARTTENGAIDGLATEGFSFGTTFSQGTASSGKTSNGSKIENGLSGDTTISQTSVRPSGTTTTYSQTNHTHGGTYSGANTRFVSSNVGAYIRNYTTSGVISESVDSVLFRKKRSDRIDYEASVSENNPQRAVNANSVQSANGGTTYDGVGTTTSARNNVGGTIEVIIFAPYIRSTISKTSIEYEYGSENYTIYSTAEYTKISSGGNTYNRTQSHVHDYRSGKSEVTYDSEGNAGVYTTGYTDTDDGTTANDTESGAPYNTSFSGSSSGSQVKNIIYGRSYFKSNQSFEIYDGGLSVGTTSSYVSRVYGIPSSLSNEDTMRIYIAETAEASQTVEDYSYSETVETNSIVTSPYNYDYFEISTIVYEGGWGVYGFTDTSVLPDSVQFTTFVTSDVSTSVELNTGSKEITTISLACPSYTETSLKEIVITRPTTTGGPGRDMIRNISTETTCITINSDSPTATYIYNNNFGGEAATSTNTIEGDQTIYFETTSNVTNRNSTETTNRGTTFSVNQGVKTFALVSNFFRAPVTISDTYFDLGEVQTFTYDSFYGQSTYSAETFTNVGVINADVSKTITRPLSKRNTIIDNIPQASLVTFSSKKLGIVYISDSTSKVDERNNIRPPNIKYTQNFLTTTTQSYASIDATVHSTTTRIDSSYDIPFAQKFSIHGFNYLIRDETLTVHDANNNSITYEGTNGSIESRATFNGTYTTRSTLFDKAEVDATDTYTGHKKFYKFFENNDGGYPIDDFLTVDTQVAYGGGGTYNLYFGGCRHYNSNGSLHYKASKKFTLVGNDIGDTTEISGDLANSLQRDSTKLDKHSRYFISTKSEIIVGSQDINGEAITIRTYKREKDVF